MRDTPQVLLGHHLRKLRLPTFLAEWTGTGKMESAFC